MINKQKIMILILLIVFVLSMSFVSAGEVHDNLNASDTQNNLQTTEVNELQQSNDEGVLNADPGTFTQLNAIINDPNVHDGDEVKLYSNYAYVDSDGEDLKRGIPFTKNIIINGQGHTISGSNVARIFAVGSVSNVHVNVDNVVLKNINFVNSYNPETKKDPAYGAVDFHGTGSIDHCNFSYNVACSASAISWRAGNNVNITNCIFTANTGFGQGGGAIRFKNAMVNVNIQNCIFKSNTVATDAAAIHSDKNAGSSGCTINNCTFIDNAANGGAGAVFFATDNTVISNSRFINNSGKTNGGAIYWRGNSGKIIYSNFTDNHATNAGAIYWTGSNGIIDHCIFTGNYAESTNPADGKGGAVYIVKYNIDCRNTTFSYCTFENNRATCDGGAINWNNDAFDGMVIYSTFINNHADEDGGSILWNGTNGTIEHSSFIDNTAGDDGGALCWRGNVGTIYNITCLNNHGISLSDSSSRGGTICLTGDDVSVSDSTFTSSSVIYTDGSDVSKIDGGALFITGSNVNITNVSFKDCSASHYGGTIHIIGSNVLIEKCSFDTSNADYGGIIFVEGNDAVITSCNLTKGVANHNGGAIYIKGTGADVVYSNFDRNTAVAGGALFWDSGSTGDFVKHSNFTNNKATEGSGGAIYWGSGGDYGLILNSTFYNNTALYYAGGVYWSLSSHGTIENSTFTKNTAGANGGALCWDGNDGYLIDTVFDSNYAEGLYVSHSNFAGGGAVSWSASNGEFLRCKFINNTCPPHGGVVYGMTSTNLTVNYCVFENNSASNGAGGVFFLEKSSGVNFYNSNFTNNLAKGSSGVIYFNGLCDHSKAINCTFTQNHAWEAGVSRWNINHGLIYNCTFLENYLYDSPGSKDHHGGVIDFGGTNNTIDECRFINNSIPSDTFLNSNECFGAAIFYHATNSKIINSNFTGNHGNMGGAIFSTAPSGLMYGLRFINNSGYSGGAIIVKEKAGAGNPANTVIYDCYFENNTAYYNNDKKFGGQGGAVYWSGSLGTLYNSTFVINNARNGGAVFWEGSDGELYDCNFTKNNASLVSDSYGGSIQWSGSSGYLHDLLINQSYCTAYGGAIYVSGRFTELDDITIINSSARRSAGAIHLRGNNMTVSNVNICNSSSNNDKNGGGGAIYSEGATYNTLINITIENTFSTTHGGAIYWAGDYGNLINITITNSKGYSKRGEDSNGGAIYWSAASGSLTNVNITNSSCESHDSRTGALKTNSYGGAIYWSGASGSLTNVSIVNSKTYNNGGAVCWVGNNANLVNVSIKNASTTNYGGALYLSQTGNIENSNFTQCSAKSGGAIYTVGSSEDKTLNIIISDSIFTNNKATSEGGAIYSGFIRTLIENSVFNNNVAENGGAIVVANDNQEISFCNFTGNNATKSGGAVYVKSFTQIVIHDSTFKKSYAYDGGAIYNVGGTGASVYINNDTFIKNLASHNGGAIYYVVDADSANKVIYRDYNNFDNRGIIDANHRTTLDMTSTEGTYNNRIFESYFKDNEDYLLNVSSIASTDTLMGIVYIYNPKDAHKRYLKIIINVTQGDRLIEQVIVDQSNYDRYFNPTLGLFAINIQSPEMDKFMTYDVNIGFEDDVYLYKEANTSFTTGDTDDIGDFTLLQRIIDNAISEAHGGVAEITLQRSYTFTIRKNLDTSCMNITAPIKINGNGWTLSAENRCRIFNITSQDVVLNDIIFINGNSSGINGDGVDKGGAIFWAGKNGTVMYSSFRNNNASTGGGIYYNSSASDCEIYDCLFVNNSATTNGGAIECNASNMGLYNTTFESNYADTGAALCREVNATLGHGFNNTFRSNHAKTNGSALAWINANSIHIDTYFFYDNTAGNSGGAIYVGKGSGNCEILNSVFVNNNVTDMTSGHGGAIEWYAEEGLVLNSTFIRNNAFEGGAIYVGSDSGKINVSGSTFTANNAFSDGGAIFIDASSVTINASNFYNNTAKEGGALYVGGVGTTNYVYSSLFEGNNATSGNGGAIDWVASSSHIIDSNFTRNFAEYGGGLYLGGISSESVISNCIFYYNHAKYDGGAIDCNASKMNLTYTVFDSNYARFGAALCRETNAKGGFGENNTFLNNHAFVAGAALAWMGSVGINITNYTFINNSADVSGGAIYVSPESHNCSVFDSRFEDNYVTNKTNVYDTSITWTAFDGEEMSYSLVGFGSDIGVGGAISYLASNATVLNSNFTNNSARMGGALFVGGESGNTIITNSIFTANNALEKGGAISLDASAVNVTQSKFYYNTAVDGGALFVGGEGTTNYVSSSLFDGNIVTGRGGAIDWLAYAGLIVDSNFTANYANYGGGIYLNGVSSNSNITNVSFNYNVAYKNGGAIDCNSSNMGLYNTTFQSNYAGEYGAALCRESDATGGHGKNNTFISNHAGISGAALAWLGVKDIHINNYTFINNTAERSGGAIYISKGSDNCVVFNSTFDGNKLTNMTDYHFGGAIDCVGDNLTVNMSSFKDNAAHTGGAIYVGADSSQARILKSNFTSNYAYGDGGAIGLKAHDLTITDVYFKDNAAGSDGGAVHVGGSGESNVIYNSVFEDNEAGNRGGAIDWLAKAGEIMYSNFTKNSAEYGGAIYLNGVSSKTKISNIIFKENSATENGGAIDCNATEMNLTNTKFISNTAKYGAGLCRESGATGGFGGNNTFDKNHATVSGAALAWLGVDNIKINNYTFTNNTADFSGGAIFVNVTSSNCKVYNSTFNDNYVSNAIDGRGGAIDWLGNNGTVVNTTFTRCISVNGGAIYVGNQSDNMTITTVKFTECSSLTSGGAMVLNGDHVAISNSTFISCSAKDYGGAIAGFGSNNLNISDSYFKYNTVGIRISPQGVYYGEGGAIYLENSRNFRVSDSKFASNAAHLSGGSISAENCSDSVICNITTHDETAFRNGGSIAWTNSNNVTIKESKFNDSGANYKGGTLYLDGVNATVKDTLINSTWASWDRGGAIYVSGNVNVSNVTFNDTHAYYDNATAIYFNSGTSNVIDSKFTNSYNSIGIAKGANVTFARNTLTADDPNKDTVKYIVENTTEAASRVKYTIWNEGDLYLDKNVFDYVIFNNGTIWTKTTTKLLGNETHNVTWNETFVFFAEITDDNDNTIISVKSLNTTNDIYTDPSNHYILPYNADGLRCIYQGVFHLTAIDNGLKQNEVKNGTLNVKMPVTMEVSIEQPTIGNLVITTTLRPKVQSNASILNEKIFFKLGDQVFDVTFSCNQPWESCTVVHTLNNLSSGTYTLTAVYNGDELHLGANATNMTDVLLRESWIKVFIQNVNYGETAMALISSNSNGTVTFNYHGKNQIVEVTMTRTSDGNYSGSVEIPVEDYLTTGNHDAGVFLEANGYYKAGSNITSFVVYKLNTTVVANPISVIKVGDKQVIAVTVNENYLGLNASGFVNVTLAGETYYKKLDQNGKATLNVYELTKGNYQNIDVEYMGDDYFNGNTTKISFTVGQSDDYNITVLADNIKYGQNATIYISLPTSVTQNLTVYLNNTKIENVVVKNGLAKVIVPNLKAGSYVVNVTYPGDDVYAAKDKNGTLFNVTASDDWTLNLTVESHMHGQNTIFNVKVPTNVATKLVNLTIDGKYYPVSVDANGVATLTLNNLSGGFHNVIANYSGDANYTAKINSTTFYIEQAPSQVNISLNGRDINATVTPGATGTVRFFINGKIYESEIVNGNATLIGKLTTGNNTIVAMYNGDENYTGSLNLTNTTVDREISKVNVTVQDTPYGDTVQITVQTPIAQSGYVTITVNNESYTKKLENGITKFNVTGLKVDKYTVNVTYDGDANYTANTNSTTFNVTQIDLNPTVIGVNVTKAMNSTFIIVVPSDYKGQVNITVDGETYIGDVESIIQMAKLEAGEKVAHVEFSSDNNYKGTAMDVNFTVSKSDEVLVITEVVNNSTIVVTVPENVTGYATVILPNGTNQTVVITNGSAVITLENMTPGDQNITIIYSDGENNITTNVTVTIPKYDSEISVDVSEVKAGESATVTVNVPVNATGTITVTIDGVQYTTDNITGGVAVITTENLTAGPKTIVVEYSGDSNFTANYTVSNFTVGSGMVDPGMTVVDYGNGTVVVVVEGNATGNVTIKVGDQNFTAEVINGTAVVEINNVTPGVHEVEVIYSGDDTHNNVTVNANITAPKYDSFVNVTVGEAKEGLPVVITVNVPVNATGNVTVSVGGKEYVTDNITDGVAVITVDNLTAGDTTIVVEYSGDSNYSANYTVSNFTVGSGMVDPGMTVVDYGNGTVVVVVEGNATGNVTIKVGDQNFTAEVINGTAVVEINNVTPGVHEVEVIYSGDDTHNNVTVNANITAPKYDTLMNITVGEAKEGEPVVITVNVPVNATGTITVTIDGVQYTTDNITNGVAVITTENLTAGPKSVVVEYSGDGNYSANYTISNFTVEAGKIDPGMTVVDYGNGTVVVVVEGNATGNVTIKVGDQNFTAEVINGTAVVEINNVTPGVHEVEVIYSGDDTHNNVTVNANITAPKYDSFVNVTVGDAKAGEPVVITVNVPVNATGNVTVSVGGKEYVTDNITDGVAVITVDNLTAGDTTIVVEYSGDSNFTANYTVSNFTVGSGMVDPGMTVVDYGNGTVVVVVEGNATGNVTIKVGDQNFTAEVINGTAVVEINNVTPGVHEVEVIYSGDDTHNNVTVNANITAPKYDSFVNVTVGEAKEGLPVVITVNVPVNATGTITVTIDGVQYTTDNITGGVATITTGNLTAGPKTIVVEYSGDDNYSANYTISNFTVEAGMIDSEVIVVDHGNGTVVVVVGDNATGNVSIKVGDQNFTAEVINGTAVVEINNVTPGVHEVEVIYSGDGTHNNVTVNANITAPKYDSFVNVTVGEAKEGLPVVITVNVPVNATGNVTVSVGGKVYVTDNITGGVAVITVDSLPAGDTTIVVEYSGDDNYAANYTVSNFTIESGKVDSEVIVVDHGNGTVVVVVGDNATGNVTVKVGNETFNATVINGTAVVTLDNVTPGTHEIEVIYSGDGNHTNATANATISISNIKPSIKIETSNINVGDKAIINVLVSDGVTGDITIEIDGVNYTKAISGGVASFEVENLTAGLKSVFAVYAGNGDYGEGYAIAQFNVSKVETGFNVTIKDINVGENVTVVITLPDDATGQILIDIDGVGYYANVTNGVATAHIPYLPSGTYDVDLTYTGDEKYTLSSNKTVVKVQKMESFVIPMAYNIQVGENEIIRLIVPTDATGSVTLIIDSDEYTFNLPNGALGTAYVEGEKYSVAISGGKGEITISGLPKGEYVVSVKYNGDHKYLPSTNSTIFTVSKIDTPMDVVDYGNGTVKVILPKDATGNVTVKVDNKTYVVPVENGTAVITLNNTSPGTHDAEIIYSGDNDYSSKTVNTTVDVPKYDTPISVSVDDIYVGDTAVVTVNVPKGASGNVTIEINGVEYSTKVSNGRATFNVKNLAYGSKTVAVTYSGDKNYLENFTTGQFKVLKRTSTVTAASKDISAGKDEVITVTVPKDATGRVLVNIDGVGYYGTVENGKAKVIIPNLEAGKYKATVIYEGDDKYLPSTTTTSFKVTSSSAPISAIGDEITVGEDAVVVIDLPEDATGTVTIEIAGKTFTTEVIDGKASFVIPGLTVGVYPVLVYYSGDVNYPANETITYVIVNEKTDGNDTPISSSVHAEMGLSKYPTGNPILMLLLALLAVGSIQIRRFKK